MSSNIKMAAVDPDTAVDQRQLFLLVLPPIMLPIFLAVVDSTIVTTALPAMAASFGEVQRISWVVVGYLVANTIAAPVYGRLADMFGRRQLMQMAIGLFCAASVLCALSTSLPMLVLARLLQGLGGGGLMTLSQALIGERVPARQRGHFQGYLAAVIVFASTFGPVAGGFLTEAFGWPSVFGSICRSDCWRWPWSGGCRRPAMLDRGRRSTAWAWSGWCCASRHSCSGWIRCNDWRFRACH
jgi:MFS family permease